MLRNKKILFVGPVFHDYHLLITKNLNEMGAETSFFPERSYSIGFKLVNNFFNKSLKNFQRNYYKRLLTKIKNKRFDFLFVVRGFMMPSDFLIEFKRLNPNAILLMYQWDSNKSNPFSHLLGYFDHVYSFDFEDCKNYPDLKYLPLFFSDDVVATIENKKNVEYDFFFMGWFFPERYHAILKFREYAKKNNFKLKAFLYMPLTSYIKERLRGHRLDRTIISLRPMKRVDYLKYLQQSKAMVDVSSPNQTGLSMRVIETLASGTKLLTNNFNIKVDNDIYNEDNINFIDENNPKVDVDFINSFLKPSKNEVLLSISGWLKRMFLN